MEKNELHGSGMLLHFKKSISGPGWCGSVAEWHPVKQRVTGSIPSQGTCLDCGPGPSRGRTRGHYILMFPSLSPFLLLCLTINK